MQDKRMPINQGDPYDFLGSDSEPTSSRSSWKRKKGQVLPPSISYRGFFPDDASTSVPVEVQMPMMPASASTSAVGLIATPLAGHPPTSRTIPLWGKGDPPISVTGMLPRLLGKTWAGRNTWQHTCSLDSPEFKDTLLIVRAKKGSEHTPEEHMILSCALKYKKAQAHASRPASFMIPPGITKDLTTSMMQTWLMNEAACPPAVRKEPDNMLNLLDIDFWLWYQKVTPKAWLVPLKLNSGRCLVLPDVMTYWPSISIKCQTVMIAVCGWEPQLHVPDGMKGQMRIQKSSNGSASMLALPLSVSQRL